MRIAISGKSGCGNTTITRMVSETLGVRMVNYTFRSLAEEKGIEFEQLCQLAEQDPSWDRYLDARQVELAMEGDSILGSRLAIWMLQEADLKVYLTAPPEIRAQRIQQREGGDLHAVLEKTSERDRKDRNRYLRLYNIDNDDTSAADMVIDTSDKTPAEITDMIVARAQQLQG
ncbi:(d)CMP kinase [Spirochaeta africana]|uniref:Cytidylate kinase n=1 Tax=Spirochaeta africana (strain ATCC 700263 / DSM 8902 / Z-7692) TaxID=889378 RepID=H9ULR4_SPIAZ|nr:AAA family ATPase [Spirochaeta africana]AFG38457.1 cytidylate kinase, putative [Spirochaeta africana DSM 8902]